MLYTREQICEAIVNTSPAEIFTAQRREEILNTPYFQTALAQLREKNEKEYEIEYQLIDGKIDLSIYDKINKDTIVNSFSISPNLLHSSLVKELNDSLVEEIMHCPGYSWHHSTKITVQYLSLYNSIYYLYSSLLVIFRLTY